ncbi:MAG: DMT family transporter [Ahrensia sp.]|nr:DMT family transporter [Ahrensia sp.]
MQDNKTAYILLLFTTLFWGGNAIAGKMAVGHISPMVLTSLRWTIALTILLLIGGKQFWQERQLALKSLPLLFAYGALGFAIFNITLYSALNYTSAINIAIEQAAVPAVIFIGNFILFRTRVTWLQIVGFSLSLVGVAIVASNGKSLSNIAQLEVNRGDAYMALGVLVYAAYSVSLRYKPTMHWKTMTIPMAFSALIVSLPFSYFELQSGSSILPDQRGLLIALYTAYFPAIISQVLWVRGIELIGANRAGIFINLVPIIGTLLAVFILGEIFQLYHAIALVFVIGGIWLAEKSGQSLVQMALSNKTAP